jgi:hypothetical protein
MSQGVARTGAVSTGAASRCAVRVSAVSRVLPALGLAAAALLLGGCRSGAAAAPAVGPPDRPAAASGTATNQPDPQRLADVESTLDRIERELDSDGSR